MIGRQIPGVTLKARVRNETIGGDNLFRRQDLKGCDEFAGEKVIGFSLSGA